MGLVTLGSDLVALTGDEFSSSTWKKKKRVSEREREERKEGNEIGVEVRNKTDERKREIVF
ncbi:MAG: hypothetical protein Q8P67_13250 [archaeon]|nr:hypothetical protein [archaeon]